MRFFQNLRKWQDRAKAIGQLRRLPPELLVDMGIEPGTEEQAVRGLIARRDGLTNRPPQADRAEKVAFALYPR